MSNFSYTLDVRTSTYVPVGTGGNGVFFVCSVFGSASFNHMLLVVGLSSSPSIEYYLPWLRECLTTMH